MGFEPTISSVTGKNVNRYTTRPILITLVPRAGIEPTLPAYETGLDPIYSLAYNELYVAGFGIAPKPPAYETGDLLLVHPTVFKLFQLYTILQKKQIFRK